MPRRKATVKKRAPSKKRAFHIALAEDEPDEIELPNDGILRFGSYELVEVKILRRRSSVDIIIMELGGPSPFPALGYPATVHIETASGYAERWLARAFGLHDVEVIEV
jgi:hypothetical protein